VVLVLLDVGLTEESTRVAHVYAVAVRHIKQSLLEEASRTMRNHAISLHFSETKSTVTGATLRWLPSQNLSGATSSRVNLIADHMFKTLVIGGTQEDHDFEALAGEARVEHLIAVPLVAQVMQLRRNEVNSLSLERSSVTLVTIE